MELKFDHTKGNIMESLGQTRDRMDEIVEGARLKMMDNAPEGTKSQQLDYMLRECKNESEMVAATVVWVSITNQMQNRENYNRAMEEREKSKFEEKIMGANPDLKIVR